MLKYLTYSIVKDFLTCPEKVRFFYVEKLRKPSIRASCLWGTGIHFGIEKFYKTGIEPWDTFKSFWISALSSLSEEIEYKDGESKESLLNIGEKALVKWFKHEETPKEGFLVESNEKIEIFGIPFYAVLDFVGENGNLLIDWKTSSYRYDPVKANYDLQLTAYSYVLANTIGKTPKKVGWGVFLKKSEPKIKYVWGRQRTKEDFENFEKIVLKVWRDVERGEFYKNLSKHCLWCDFFPLCLGEVDMDVYKRNEEEPTYFLKPQRVVRRISLEEEDD